MVLTYREASLSDVENLRTLGIDSYQQFEHVLNPLNWNKMYSFLSAEQSYRDLLSKSTCFVCEFDNQIIGMAFLVSKGNPTEIFEKDWTYLRMVGVHPNFSGKGIGRELIKICILFAKESDEKIIALHTSEFMNSARHLYEDLGFVMNKELKPIFDKKYWLYLLKL